METTPFCQFQEHLFKDCAHGGDKNYFLTSAGQKTKIWQEMTWSDNNMDSSDLDMHPMFHFSQLILGSV